MISEFKYGLPVMLTKDELLQLSVLAGEDMSISEYVTKVLREHVQQNVHLTGGGASAFKQLYEGKFDTAPEDDTSPPRQGNANR